MGCPSPLPMTTIPWTYYLDMLQSTSGARSVQKLHTSMLHPFATVFACITGDRAMCGSCNYGPSDTIALTIRH